MFMPLFLPGIVEVDCGRCRASHCLGDGIFDGHGDDLVMVVLPADHMIKDEQRFCMQLKRAIKVAERGQLTTFGIQPMRPDTDFGYIKAHLRSIQDICAVEHLTERPDNVTAECFLEEGDYCWNSGTFAWRASVIREEFGRNLPEGYRTVDIIFAESQDAPGFQRAVENHFPAMLSISIDYGVLEKSKRAMYRN